jgi:hypothetical protein
VSSPDHERKEDKTSEAFATFEAIRDNKAAPSSEMPSASFASDLLYQFLFEFHELYESPEPRRNFLSFFLHKHGDFS